MVWWWWVPEGLTLLVFLRHRKEAKLGKERRKGRTSKKE